MNVPRKNVIEVVGQLEVSALSVSSFALIEKMKELIAQHGDSVSLDVDDEGCYSGYYSYNVCIQREQTEEEYNAMLVEMEKIEQRNNQDEVKRLVAKSLSGKNLTKKERAFLLDYGITLN